MDQYRNKTESCSHYRRNRNEASFRKQNLWPYTKHDPNRLENSPEDLEDIQHILPREITAQLARRNRMEMDVQTRLQNLLVFNPFLVSNIMNFPTILDEARDEEKVQGHMPNCTSPCKYYFFHINFSTLLLF